LYTQVEGWSKPDQKAASSPGGASPGPANL
jgi:hypothetical protein